MEASGFEPGLGLLDTLLGQKRKGSTLPGEPGRVQRSPLSWVTEVEGEGVWRGRGRAEQGILKGVEVGKPAALPGHGDKSNSTRGKFLQVKGE